MSPFHAASPGMVARPAISIWPILPRIQPLVNGLNGKKNKAGRILQPCPILAISCHILPHRASPGPAEPCLAMPSRTKPNQITPQALRPNTAAGLAPARSTMRRVSLPRQAQPRRAAPLRAAPRQTWPRHTIPGRAAPCLFVQPFNGETTMLGTPVTDTDLRASNEHPFIHPPRVD